MASDFIGMFLAVTKITKKSHDILKISYFFHEKQEKTGENDSQNNKIPSLKVR